MKKKFFIIILLLLTLSGCSTSPQVPTPPTVSNTDSIPIGQFYFYSASCPHCATVNEYVATNHIKERFYYIEREVDNTTENIQLLQRVAAQCGVGQADIAVPFFWDGQHCYQGSDEVINYLASQ